MPQLYMNGRCIQSLRDLRAHFSPVDMLRCREAFASSAAALAGGLNGDTVGNANIFALTVLFGDGRPAPDPSVALLCHDRIPAAANGTLADLIQSFSTLTLDGADPCETYARWIGRFSPEGSAGLFYTIGPGYRPLVEKMHRIARETELSPRLQAELFLLLVSGCRLAGIERADQVRICAVEAEAAFLRRQSSGVDALLAPDAQTVLPESGELILPARETPYRLLLHPAWYAPPSPVFMDDSSGVPARTARTLPAGCFLHTHRLLAAPSAFGSAVLLHFCRGADDPAPLCASIPPGGHLYLNAVHTADGSHPPMPLAPLPRRVTVGSRTLEAIGPQTDALRLTASGGMIASIERPGARITSFTPIDNDSGMVFLQDGALRCPGCPEEFNLPYLSGVTDFVEAAFDGVQLLLLRRNGSVHQHFENGRRCAENVLTLADLI